MIIKQAPLDAESGLGVAMITRKPYADGFSYRVMAQFACGFELADKSFLSEAKALEFFDILTRTPNPTISGGL